MPEAIKPGGLGYIIGKLTSAHVATTMHVAITIDSYVCLSGIALNAIALSLYSRFDCGFIFHFYIDMHQ